VFSNAHIFFLLLRFVFLLFAGMLYEFRTQDQRTDINLLNALLVDAVNRLQRHQGSTVESGNTYGHDPRLDASLAAKKFYTQRNM
jgi:hypothetical protein